MKALKAHRDEAPPYAGDPFAAIVAELRAIRELLAARPGETSAQPASGPLTLLAAAERLGVSEQTLRRAEKAGKFRPARFGRRLLIPADEVERLAREGLGVESIPGDEKPNQSCGNDGER